MTGVAVVLPGRGYTALGPAIRFPVLAAEEAGYAPVVVEYPPEALAAQDLAAVEGSVRRQIIELVAGRGAGRVTVIAKSLGTRMLTRVADLFDGVDPLSVIWLTPLFGDPDVARVAVELGSRSLIVVGEDDPLHDPSATTGVARALGAPVVALTGADHALEVPGDARATLTGLQTVTIETLHFLSP